ncbi:type II toxin-antitoxin system VapB family antitoxin [Endothiovibrio diazotrophicus]
MRTNIVLDDELVDEAFKFSSATTKRELIDCALKEFVATHKRKNLLDLYGSNGIREEYDHKALREGRD